MKKLSYFLIMSIQYSKLKSAAIAIYIVIANTTFVAQSQKKKTMANIYDQSFL